MTFRALKNRVFLLEGINGLATAYYFNYIFFYLTERHGVGNAGNLLFCAANGFIYIFASLYAGSWAQKHGYFNSLRLGFFGIIVALLTAIFASTITGQVAAMIIWSLSVCFTWPSLEALSADHETSRTLPGKIGAYNIVWSATQALGFFTGGKIADLIGYKNLFIFSAALHLIQLFIVARLRHAGPIDQLPGAPIAEKETHHEAASPEINRRFLRMAWLANPFAYIAMNTIIPLIPALAERFQLSTAVAGYVGSVWMFARMAAFGLLWRWTGWHYRFGWLVSSFILLIFSFATILLAPNLTILILAQLVLGWATGLIYYSSLFYSMDASDTKGAHGGIHEAAIGLGIFGGPAIGYTALYFFPTVANSSVWAVSAILTLGLGGLFFLRKR